MIHSLKLKGNDIEVDIYEISKYPILNTIYTRDKSTDKLLARQELMYIHFIADKTGYCAKAGLSSSESHIYARDNAGLNDKYKPDKAVLDAIEFIKLNMSITVVEELLSNTMKGLALSSKIASRLIESLESVIEDPEASVDQIIEAESTIKRILSMSSDIPSRIETLKHLQLEWDKESKQGDVIRGGKQFNPSYDGEDSFGTTSDSQHMRM